jgi:hypothetical protein
VSLAKEVIKIMLARKLKRIAGISLAASMVIGVGLMSLPRLLSLANAADKPVTPISAEMLRVKPAPQKSEDHDPGDLTSPTQPKTDVQPQKPELKEEPAKTPQPTSWAAKFFPDGLTHDFGKVTFDSRATHRFKLFNIYAVPFVIREASPSSDCVTVVVPSGPFEARESTELVVYVDTRKMAADGRPKTVRILVRLTSDSKNPDDPVYSASCVLTVAFAVQANVRTSKD